MTKFSGCDRIRRLFGRKSVPLRQRVVGRRTRARYDAALRRFNRYCTIGGLAFNPSDFGAADCLVERYVQALYDLGAPRSWASIFLSALNDRFPRLRRELPSGWRSVRAWQFECPPKRAPPIPRRLVSLWAGRLLFGGRIREAAGLLLLFHCFLRPAELLKLRVCDVVLCGLGLATATVRLIDTKMGQRRLAEEFVEVLDPFVARLLAIAISGRPGHEPLVPWSYPDLRRLVREFAALDNLVDVGFVPYSFRRGGASFFFRATGSFDAALQRGRWQSVKSAKIYINEARARYVSCLSHECYDLSVSYERAMGEFYSQSGGFGDSVFIIE